MTIHRVAFGAPEAVPAPDPVTIVTNRGDISSADIGVGKVRGNPVLLAETRQIQKLIQEEREVELRRQRERQILVDKILFHHRRGMSRGQLERNWGVEAVKAAFDALSPSERPEAREVRAAVA